MHVVIQVYREVLTFLASHLIVTIAGCVFIGIALGITTYGTIYYRRERLVRRLIDLLEHSGVTSVEITSWFWKVSLQETQQQHISRAIRAQGPAAHATANFAGSTVHTTNGRFRYYFPEVLSTELPCGIEADTRIDLIFGDPPMYRATLRLQHVVARVAGRWYPAVVEDGTGSTIERHRLSKRDQARYWVRGYRNLIVCDFVNTDAPLGTVFSSSNGKPTCVPAPCDGFIVTFEVLPYTNIAADANVMFLGVPNAVCAVTFTGDRAGTFAYADDGASPIGQIIREGTLLCTVTSLGIQQPVYMPATGFIVRQYKEPGDRVDYRTADLEYEKLFDYVPLETEPLS